MGSRLPSLLQLMVLQSASDEIPLQEEPTGRDASSARVGNEKHDAMSFYERFSGRHSLFHDTF